MKKTYLLATDRYIAEAEHVSRVIGQPVKCAQNPVIAPDRPWDNNGVARCSVVFDSAEKRFKAWYASESALDEKQQWLDDPTKSRLRPRNIAYATSTDGIHWDKPELGIIEFQGSKKNNLVDSHDTEGVILDEHDADPARRFKRLSYDSSLRELHFHFSPDGIHWIWATEGGPLFKGWDVVHDTHFLMGWDESLGKYVAFLRPPTAPRHGLPRRIGISLTDDVLRWPAPNIILEPDELDPPGMDLYWMSGFVYEGLHIGILSNFYGQFAGEWNDPTRLSLAFSDDGLSWSRPLRSPLLQPGDPGLWDCGTIYALAKPIAHDDRIYVYYDGSPHVHAGNGPSREAVTPDMHNGIGLAFLRLDGFAGLYTNPYPGRILTKPIEVTGSRLLFNARPDEPKNGWLRVEVIDQTGKPVEGFTRESAVPVTTDGIYSEIRWAGDRSFSELRGRTVRLCIYQRECVTYAFRITD